ncbi:MAG: pseudaminic acid cytidylyltransferase [Desulfobacterales bacterium PC51MH44]|jgi:pseudaminic acid cytidylyltransferase|nr:MAG: pseudaminic acid cytidylyltransferase [Desulfobacterales bacterium PC51MH44]
MKRIAIIPARGGSKRLPRKNIIDFLGKPIIAYTIEAALQTSVFDRVIVSTEDTEIAEVAIRFGAQVSKRPASLATDASTVVEVCSDLLEREKADGRIYDILCCLYATAPLRTSKDIINTLQLLEDDNCDSAMALTNYHFPPHQALKLDKFQNLIPVWLDMINMKSQEVPDFLVDNGSTYAINVAIFKEKKSFLGDHLKGYIMPRIRSVDIDTQEDLDLAYIFFGRDVQ